LECQKLTKFDVGD